MSIVNVSADDTDRTGLLEDDREANHEKEEFRNGQPVNPSSANYEVALKETGFGKFNILLLALCGWAQISDSMEILSVSFLLPVASKDLGLTDVDKGILNAIIFLGMMVGGYVWGALADIKGRKGILVYSLATNAIFGLISSFAQSFWLFLVCRFISGIGVGGTIPVVFSYFGEFQQRRHRGAMISALSTCWMMGNIVTAGLAWWIIPSNIGYKPDEPGKFSYQSWRVFVAICVIPAATSAVSFMFLPESPKFLLEIGKEEKALSVLRKMYQINKNGRSDQEFRIRHLISSRKAQSDVTVRGETRRLAIVQVISATMQLFRGPLLRITISLLVIVFSLSFGYYGLWMWFPQIFAQVEFNNGTACSTENVTINVNSSAIYRDAFLTALSNLPGNIITILFMDRLGRRFLMSLSLILSGVSVFFIWFVSTRIEVLITSLCFGGASVIAWNTLNVLGVELYPTHLRSTALGVQSVLNRIGAILGNLLFGVLIHVHCAVPLLTVALLLTIAGLTTLTLPNTTKVSLQ